MLFHFHFHASLDFLANIRKDQQDLHARQKNRISVMPPLWILLSCYTWILRCRLYLRNYIIALSEAYFVICRRSLDFNRIFPFCSRDQRQKYARHITNRNHRPNCPDPHRSAIPLIVLQWKMILQWCLFCS